MILGLSHVFGEVAALDIVAEYWTSKGWTSVLNFDLPVPAGKSHVLENQRATDVSLHYLERENARNLPGLEFVRHTPATTARTSSGLPAISLRLPMQANVEFRDPEGNTVIGLEQSAFPVVELDVPDVERAHQRLCSLGFRASANEQSELTFSQPLFPQRAFVIRLRNNPTRPRMPVVDEGGWNGISLLVKDLDQIGATLPALISRQSFSVVDGQTRDVGFYAGDGLLLEFLAIRKS